MREFGRLLHGFAWRLLSLDDVAVRIELSEPGPGYRENALAKAVAVTAATGLWALADDSGIEVDALRGWPGPQSARWLGDAASDTDRLRGLLGEVERRSPDDRRCRYVCVVALARPGAQPVTAQGTCLGELVEPKGERGFGYDPAFRSADLGITFAEAGAEAKDRVSHRARAIARLAESGLLDNPQA
ncbi:MAG: non-canonical purine NTP pyrophosphatase [Candidatus Dormibacteraeota bacterium]|nr:non-canonical purine NTP pyrophosphatase [Candidatus Dormibacteraeota bacterium]